MSKRRGGRQKKIVVSMRFPEGMRVVNFCLTRLCPITSCRFQSSTLAFQITLNIQPRDDVMSKWWWCDHAINLDRPLALPSFASYTPFVWIVFLLRLIHNFVSLVINPFLTFLFPFPFYTRSLLLFVLQILHGVDDHAHVCSHRTERW